MGNDFIRRSGFPFWVLTHQLLLSACVPANGAMPHENGLSGTFRGGDDGPTIMFTAEPATVEFGEPVYLSWSAPANRYCEASGEWAGARPSQGSEFTAPLTENSVFYLSCSKGNEAALHKIAIDVLDITPDLILHAANERLPANGRTTLRWDAKGARICQARGGWSGSMPIRGTYQTQPLNESTHYYLTCTSNAGTALASVRVEIFSSTHLQEP